LAWPEQDPLRRIDPSSGGGVTRPWPSSTAGRSEWSSRSRSCGWCP